MKTKEQLKQNYEKAVNGYLYLFCKKHEFDYEDAKDSWVANDVGGIVFCADYFVDMETIRADIDTDAPEEEFLKWYDYCTDLRMLGDSRTPNFKSWLMGFPRKTPEEIEALKSMQRRIDDLNQELEDMLNRKAGDF